tara:strand:+ start:549 stop:1148 length:600 start_codon:yes stop_codon:yes gene_type:complete
MIKFIIINLNQSESAETRALRRKEQTRWGIFGLVAAILLSANIFLGFVGFGYLKLIQKKETEIAHIKEEIHDLQAKGKNLSKQDIISFSNMESKRTLWARNFELIGRLTPEDMALIGMQFNKKSKKLILEGIAVVYENQKEYEIVHEFINKLRKDHEINNNFSEFKFRQGSLKKVRGQEIVQFELEAVLKSNGQDLKKV